MQIAIIGRDGSGKSTLADYLGQCFARESTAVVIDSDLTQPTLPVRLPGISAAREQSLGRSIAGIGTTEIRPYLFQHPRQSGLFYTGLIQGDDYMDYELGLDAAAAAALFAQSCRDQLDHVILDCSGQRTDPFLPEALTQSDHLIMMLTPDLQGITWWQSIQKLLMEMSVMHKVYLIVSQMHRHHFDQWIIEGLGKKPDCFLPFTPELNQLRSAGKTISPPVTRSGLIWYRSMKQLFASITEPRGDKIE